MRRRLRLFLFIIAAATLSACAGQPTQKTLYQQLGADPGIEALVKELVVNIAADRRIRGHFRSIHIAGFRQRLENHFCTITDGPCDYVGRSMPDSHRLLNIDAAAFNALVEDLVDAMETLDIPYATQNAFLQRLIPMQQDIVIGSHAG